MSEQKTSVASIATILGYDDVWIRFGLVNDDFLRAQYTTFVESDDSCTEHWRGASFAAYFAERETLSDAELQEFLNAYESSGPDILKPDPLHQLIRYRGLSDEQLMFLQRHPLFVSSGLTRIARRMNFLRLLAAPVLAPEILRDCLLSRDADVHRALLGRRDLELQTARHLENGGANKAVRNIARQHVKILEKERVGTSK